MVKGGKACAVHGGLMGPTVVRARPVPVCITRHLSTHNVPPDVVRETEKVQAALLRCVEEANVDQAKSIIEDAKRRKLPISATSYNSLLAACAEAGDWKQALQLLHEMESTGEIRCLSVVEEVRSY